MPRRPQSSPHPLSCRTENPLPPPPVSPLLLLAAAGISDDVTDQLDRVGWFLPFLALIIPASIILFFAIPNAIYAALVAAQITGMGFGLRALIAHLRRTGFTSFQVRIMLGPLYLIACFATNIVAFLAFGILHKFF